ncbi:carbohydrate ABC transporter permease [Streptosporangium sp. CA-115845]|uniref:carbohydrate ABC transporter permease n=1 Tax=Streptosporangium sp. CA-115845 TaxID=3240071 RepID=UPI003D8A8146
MAERTTTVASVPDLAEVAASRRPAGSATRRRAGRPRGPRRRERATVWTALLWLGPALLLIGGVVIYPAIELVRASLGRYSITGLRLGDAGGENYTKVLAHPMTSTVLMNTLIWVVAVVVPTLVLSLALAQFLSKEFPGRRVVRWAVLVPWAASVVITSRLFTLILDYYHGILNQSLVSLGIIDKPVDWLGDDRFAMASIITVGVFVTVPFTTYVLLAGLNSIPHDVYEAARIDGAGPWQVYRRVTLPLLRPALMIAAVLDAIYVFNSFPVVYTLNDRNPGFSNDTSITFMYKLAFKSAEHDVGMAAAAGVMNVALILVAVVIYLRLIDWRKERS